MLFLVDGAQAQGGSSATSRREAVARWADDPTFGPRARSWRPNGASGTFGAMRTHAIPSARLTHWRPPRSAPSGSRRVRFDRWNRESATREVQQPARQPERFYAALEWELLDRETLPTHTEARAAVFQFSEGCGE